MTDTPERMPDGSIRMRSTNGGSDLSPAVVRDEESPTERYERLAAEFERDTGMSAPGKDVPAELGGPDFFTRSAAWDRWWDERRAYRKFCRECAGDLDVRGVCPKCGVFPVSVPEERQEKLPQTEEEWRTYVMMQGEVIKGRYGLGEYAQQPRESVLKSALDALAVAVNGCGKPVGRDNEDICGERRLRPFGVWVGTLAWRLCGDCEAKRDAAITSLLDGRTTT